MKMNTKCLWVAFILTATTVAVAVAAPPRGDTKEAIRARLDRAQAAREAARTKLSRVEQDLLWLLNFEQPDVMYTRDHGWIPVNLEERHFAPGRFGRGYYFELPQANYLPPAMADVETDISGFVKQSDAVLESLSTETRFGQRVLSVACKGADAGFATVPVKVEVLRYGAGHQPTVSLLASCYLQGPKDTKVRLQLQFVPAELIDPKTKQPAADRKADISEPQEVTLSGEWQRVACTATGDRRLPVRVATLSIALAGHGEAKLLADGFQFESCLYYPHHRLQPTTWTPGGTSVPGTGLSFSAPSMLRAFPRTEGTVAFWNRTPPSDCNLKGTGAIDWFGFLRGWTDPQWGLSNYTVHAGRNVNAEGKPVPVYTGGGVAPATDGQWHHVAMTWNAKAAVVYRDGKPVINFLRQDPDISGLVDTYSLRIGRGREQFANSVLDEFAVFRRALTPEEIAQLAAGAAELRAGAAPVALAAGPRSVFYRDETAAQFEVKIAGTGLPNTPVTVDWSFGDVVVNTNQVTLERGRGTAVLDFSPARLKKGDYVVSVAVSRADGSPIAYREFPVQVVPALRRDNFVISTWNGGLTAAELQYYRDLGLNSINVAAEPGTVERLGALGFSFDWHFRGGEESARSMVRQIAMMPNWWRMLLNSETGAGVLPDEEARKAWFDAYVLKEFGAPIPAEGWKFGTPHNHIMCSFPADQKPGADGVYRTVPETFRFLRWWEEGGGVNWQNNFKAARAVKAIRPDVSTWTDAVQSQGQYKGLDAGGSWSYSTDPTVIWNELQQSYFIMRGTGKPFETTLGLNYVSVETTEPDGKKKNLAPTPDDAIGQAWVATGLVPSDALYYWDVNGYFDGERGQNGRYAAPGSTQALGRALKEEIGPLGTMLQGVPNSQRPMALLLPQSTLWFVAGEGGWNWGAVHYPNMWKKVLANSGPASTAMRPGDVVLPRSSTERQLALAAAPPPYDILSDYDIAPGSLAKYKVIFFPMGMYVQEQVYRELLAAAEAGTRVVVDSYCKQSYPRMARLQMKYEYWWTFPKEKQDAYFAEVRGLFAELNETLRPGLAAFAQGSEGPVLANTREADGIKYVVVVNSNRRAGPYSQWTEKPDWKPYGKPQTARVSIAAPAGSAVYEFVTSQRLQAEFRDGRLAVDVALPPAGGRLLCVYPGAFGKFEVTGGPEFTRGAAGTLQVTLLDAAGKPVHGRQLANVRITSPDGQLHDESGLYRLERGRATVPFRLALNDAAGQYRVTVTERCSGLNAEARLVVK
jgi:hypothetical protein